MPSERKYAERLREQAYKTLSAQTKDLEEELAELKNSFSSSIYQLERKLEAVNRIELPAAEVVLDEIMEDVLRQKNRDEQSISVFARDIRLKETQEEILGMLLDSASQFFTRVALFSVRKDRLEGWSSRGYEEESAQKFAGTSSPRSEYPKFEEALKNEAITAAPDLSDDQALGFLEPPSAAAQYIVPLYVLQRPVALLYAGYSEGESADSNYLSILVNLTVLRIENIALKILYALAGSNPEPPETGQEAATGAAQEPDASAEEEGAQTFEESQAESEQQETLEQETSNEFKEMGESSFPPPIPAVEPEFSEEPEVISEPEVDNAESVSVPAEETWNRETLIEEILAEETSEQVQDPITETAETRDEPPAGKIEVNEDEEGLHSDAKRFAKLLVSEIKLYNENQVVEGRKHQDLYLRLKRDIDKSREMYEKRISPAVSQKIDYFHDEIIRILGDNDASALGSDYPGPKTPE
ncbi:MAG: hypothetical protein P8Z37_07515 [Acidobacteriota bacterium]